MSRLVSGLLGLLFVLNFGPVMAQEKKDDLLDDVARRRAVAVQALKQEVQDTIAQADKLKTEPEKAATLLRQALDKLEKDDLLDAGDRVSLRLNIKERLAILEDPKARAREEEAAKQAAEIERRLAQLRADREEADSIRRELEIIGSLRAQGKLADAERAAAALARKHPNNPAVQLALQTSGTADRLREAIDLAKEKSLAYNAAMNDALRSSIPNPNDITYPSRKKWEEISKSKFRTQEIPMTEREKQIVAALNELVKGPISFKDETFEKVLEFLQKQIGQPILVNKASLKDLDITYERTLSVNLPKNITKRSLLRSVLAELGLTYIIRNETIEIMDVERAKSALTIRVYPIGDLLSMGPTFGLQPQPGKSTVDLLIDLIQDTVEPLSWEKYNGPGSITYSPAQKALIIKNSAEVINMIGGRR